MSAVAYPIPLRDNFIAELRLPIDLTKAEAEKLGRVLLALAMPESKEEK